MMINQTRRFIFLISVCPRWFSKLGGREAGCKVSNTTIRELIIYYQNISQDSICHWDGERGRPEKPTGRSNNIRSGDIQEVYRGCGNQSAGSGMITKSTQGFSLRLILNKRDWPRISILLHSLSWMRACCLWTWTHRNKHYLYVIESKTVFYGFQISFFFPSKNVFWNVFLNNINIPSVLVM